MTPEVRTRTGKPTNPIMDEKLHHESGRHLRHSNSVAFVPGIPLMYHKQGDVAKPYEIRCHHRRMTTPCVSRHEAR